MLYNGSKSDLPLLRATDPSYFAFVFPPFSLLFITNISRPPPPAPIKLSCCAACMFDLVFQWLSPSRGQGCRLGRKQSPSVWQGCHRGPLLGGSPCPPCCSQSLPQLRGHPLSPRWPISDSVGLQTHPVASPICPLWSANFLIYACKLHIFSGVKAGTQSLWGIYFRLG